MEIDHTNTVCVGGTLIIVQRATCSVVNVRKEMHVFLVNERDAPTLDWVSIFG